MSLIQIRFLQNKPKSASYYKILILIVWFRIKLIDSYLVVIPLSVYPYLYSWKIINRHFDEINHDFRSLGSLLTVFNEFKEFIFT